MYYVYSTITNDTYYSKFEDNNDKDISIAIKKVLIKGGHGIASKQLVTPYGVMTEVKNEDMEFLESNDAFQRHIEKGFITVLKKRDNDIEKVSKNLNEKDGSYPKTPRDYIRSEISDDFGKEIYKPKGINH